MARPLLALTAPGIATGLLHSLGATVNMFWVGRLLGPPELAAIVNAHLVAGLAASLFGGIAGAAGILVGHALGAGNRRHARTVVATNVALALLLSSAAAAAGMASSQVIIRLLAMPPETQGAAAIYLPLAFLALPLATLLWLLVSVLGGAGNMRTPLAAMAMLIATDIAAHPFLILGLAGLPRMGIAGSGAAYLLAHLAALALLVVLVVRSRRWRFLLPRRLAIDRGVAAWCLAKGTAMGLQFLVIAAVSVGLMSLVNRYGAATAAAYAVAATVWSYVQLPVGAVAASVTTIASHSAGAGNRSRMRRTTAAGIALSLAVTLLTVGLGYALNERIAALFLPTDPEAARIAAGINRVVLWSFLMFAVTTVLFGALRAAGDVAVPFAVICASHAGVRIPFAYLLAPHWGEAAIWWSYPAGLLTALLLACAYVAHKPPWRPLPLQPRSIPSC